MSENVIAEAVQQTYLGRERLVLIGLTGRTGSGCSKVAEILATKKYESLDLKSIKEYDYDNVDERKNKVIQNYMCQDGKWKPFSVIEVSSIILSSVFSLGVNDFINYLDEITKEDEDNSINIGDKDKVFRSIRQLGYMFQQGEKHSLEQIDVTHLSEIDIEDYYHYYLHEVKTHKRKFKEVLEEYTCFEVKRDKFVGKKQNQYHLYTFLMQKMGNNIRSSGNPFKEEFVPQEYSRFVKKIEMIIDIIKIHEGEESTRICIDAIRNPYEALYLRDRYKSFHLMAISTDDSDRKSRLKMLNDEELNNLDSVEYAQKMKLPQEVFYHQNISGCLEIADIHVYNPNVENGKYFDLTQQLLKYIALMIHPGLVTPTHLERCMQLAYNAKYNSGCLSRQVGAVVTRPDYSIQSIGWNDVPKGQLSCNLRDVHSFCTNKDKESFSQFEIQNTKFNEIMNNLDKRVWGKTSGRCMAYCFKDVYNSMTNEKNQVYTRSLHAEENAFLQISKYGGTEVKGGCLFTTASPCELCAKKAYQLGIKNIYYIDPYPGISQNHILTFGEHDNPKMNLFYGAIGEAYLDFYTPRIPIKDELEMVTGINVKSVAKGNDECDMLDYNDLKYNSVLTELEITENRSNIISTRKIDAIINKDGIEKITRRIIWTGGTYDGTKLLADSDSDISLIEIDNKLPYTYEIVFDKKKNKGDSVKYHILTAAKDEKFIMEPYLAYMVKHDTRELIISVSVCAETISDVCATIYADHEMKTRVECRKIEPKDSEELNGKKVYEFRISNANVNYTYAIEWKWI